MRNPGEPNPIRHVGRAPVGATAVAPGPSVTANIVERNPPKSFANVAPLTESVALAPTTSISFTRPEESVEVTFTDSRVPTLGKAPSTVATGIDTVQVWTGLHPSEPCPPMQTASPG